MAKNDKYNSKIAAKGAAKIIFPLVFGWYAGAAMVGFSALGMLGWLGCKVISTFSKDPEKWDQTAKELTSFSIKAFLRGISIALPIVPIIDGLYNVVRGRNSIIDQGIYAVAREVTGLPQPGDEEKITPPSSNSHPQQSQSAQQQNSQDLSPTIGEISINDVARAQTYQDAVEKYKNELNRQETSKMEMIDFNQSTNGTFIATYIPTEYTKDNCPPDLKVMQTFDNQGNVIEVNAGSRASCNTPPILNNDGSFRVLKYNNGQESNLRAIYLQSDTIQRELTSSSSRNPNTPTQNYGDRNNQNNISISR